MKNDERFLLRLNKPLFKQLKTVAKQAGLSLNQYINWRLQAVSSSHSEVVGQILNILPHKVLGIILYGSQVRGDSTPTSDTDFLVVLNPSIQIDRQLYNAFDLNLDLNKSNAIQLVHPLADINTPTKLWLEVALEGEILYDTNDTIRRTLSELKQKIAAGVYRRKMTYGQPYWITNEES